MADIILSGTSLDVFGGPASVGVSVDYGQTGSRGSKMWVGAGDPTLTLSGQEILINDTYINTSSSDPYYGWMYQYIETPGNPTWQRQYQILQGLQGIQGLVGSFGGSSFEYTYTTATTDTDPTSGKLKFNNTDLSAATMLYISKVDYNSLSANGYLQTVDDSTSTIKGHFAIKKVLDDSVSAMFAITGLHTEHTGYLGIPISYLSGSTSIANNTDTIVNFARAGDTGDQGIQGTQGLQGRQGTQGIQGPQGVQGTQGIQGIQGVQGLQGVQGTQGIQGPQGTQGIQGNQGTQGIQGNQGTQGLQGLQGNQGLQGGGFDQLQGLQGLQGNAGTVQGTQGIQGLQGTQGLQGLQSNLQGPQGTQGIQGIQGLQGTQGLQGLQGPTNTTYTAPTIGSTSIPSGTTVTTITGLTLTSPTINGGTHVLGTSSSITDATVSWDTTYKNMQVGNGTSTLNFMPFSVNTTAKSANYQLTTGDANTIVQMNGAFVFQLDTSLAVLPIGTQITLLALTTGVTVALTANATVPTLLYTPGLKLRAANSVATLIKMSVSSASGTASTWLLTGDISA
jgi:hypothetical protein